MAKRNLLDIVSSIVSDMNSDEINSISDTTESEQVASIVKDTYFELINRIDKIPEHFELCQIVAVSDTDRPNYLKYPDNLLEMVWFKYNISQDGTQEYKDILYVNPQEFVNRVMSRNSGDANVVTVMDFSGVPLLIRNDQMPNFWTSFDDEYMVFDAYLANIDSTLQNSKAMAYAQVEPTFLMEDDFIPDLDSHLFPLLLSEAKSMCFALLKQAASPLVDRSARRQLVATQNNKQKYKTGYSRPDFGRKR